MKIDYWQNLEEKHFYHIYNRSIGNEMMFNDIAFANDFLERWEKLITPYTNTLAFCIMSNHFHFIVQIKPFDDKIKAIIALENTSAANDFLDGNSSPNDFLVTQFSRLFNGFSTFYNNKKNRSGGLFQKKFKRIRLNSVEKVLEKICYVHHNPIHHGAASYYDAWNSSSFMSYFNDNTIPIKQDVTFLLLRRLGAIEPLSDDISPHVTGIYDYPIYENIDIQRFVLLHSNFHQEWFKNQAWQDFDEIGE